MPLAPDTVKRVHTMRNCGMGLKTIAREIGTSYFLVRTAIEPEYRTACRVRRQEAEKGGYRRPIKVAFSGEIVIHAPAHVIEERNHAYGYLPTLTAAFFGDPPRGRSALEKKMAGNHG